MCRKAAKSRQAGNQPIFCLLHINKNVYDFINHRGAKAGLGRKLFKLMFQHLMLPFKSFFGSIRLIGLGRLNNFAIRATCSQP